MSYPIETKNNRPKWLMQSYITIAIHNPELKSTNQIVCKIKELVVQTRSRIARNFRKARNPTNMDTCRTCLS